MKKFDRCTYLGCDFRYIGREDAGVRIMSISKHLGDVIVDYSREAMIQKGEFQGQHKGKSFRLDGSRVR